MATGNKEEWGTRLGVILAVAGSAVGVGNFLRFPGEAAKNGGGAFLIPYFAALILLGIPIGWAEWSMGRYGGRKGLHSAPAILGVVGRSRFARYFGVVGVLIPLCISFYYVFIEAWTFGYFLKYLSGATIVPESANVLEQSAASSQYFNAFSGAQHDGVLFTGDSHFTLLSWMMVFAINIYFVYRGLSKGIEKFCSYAMPAMAVCALIVLIRVLTLGTPDPTHPEQNVINGLGYLWNPNFSKLGDFSTWLAAAGQVFFSLSVGFGVIINYASYLKPKDDLALSALTASATNEAFEVGFGGMITLTASFVFLGLSGTAAAVATGSFGLGFAALPVVFAHMGPLEHLIGAIWFFMLFLAGLTSSLSMYQPTAAMIKEALGIEHSKATALVAIVAIMGSGMTLWFTQGGSFFNTLDFWVANILIYILAAAQIIYFGWVFGIERGWREIHCGASIRLPSIFKVIMKYVAPAYLAIVFAGFCWQTLGDEVTKAWTSTGGRLAVLTIIVTASFLLMVLARGEKRWRMQGLDIDDDKPLPIEK